MVAAPLISIPSHPPSLFSPTTLPLSSERANPRHPPTDPNLSSLIWTACSLFFCGLARSLHQREVTEEQQAAESVAERAPASLTREPTWRLSCPSATCEQGPRSSQCMAPGWCLSLPRPPCAQICWLCWCFCGAPVLFGSFYSPHSSIRLPALCPKFGSGSQLLLQSAAGWRLSEDIYGGLPY